LTSSSFSFLTLPSMPRATMRFLFGGSCSGAGVGAQAQARAASGDGEHWCRTKEARRAQRCCAAEERKLLGLYG
jgi:hypothetical protein